MNDINKELKQARDNLHHAQTHLEAVETKASLIHQHQYNPIFTKQDAKILISSDIMPHHSVQISRAKYLNLPPKKRLRIKLKYNFKFFLGLIWASICDFFDDNATIFVFGIGLILLFSEMFTIFPFHPLISIILFIIIVMGVFIIDGYID